MTPGLVGVGFGEAVIAKPDDVEYCFVVGNQIIASLDPRAVVNDLSTNHFCFDEAKIDGATHDFCAQANPKRAAIAGRQGSSGHGTRQENPAADESRQFPSCLIAWCLGFNCWLRRAVARTEAGGATSPFARRCKHRSVCLLAHGQLSRKGRLLHSASGPTSAERCQHASLPAWKARGFR